MSEVDRTETRTTASTGGEKGVKRARFDLIPMKPLWKLAELFGKGAEKYAERNWERGYEWSKSFAAMMRHAWLFWDGEEIDSETGCPHLTSVIWHAMAMLEWGETHPEFDDRPGAPERVRTGDCVHDWRPIHTFGRDLPYAFVCQDCGDSVLTKPGIPWGPEQTSK